MPAGLATYLMTAGHASDDYRFLGRAPREAFWRRYADHTSFERPTVILLSKNEAFRAYVSGVLSARRDRTHTPLRYTFVLEGPCPSAGADLLLRAIAAFVSDLDETKASPLKVGSLGRAFDAAFPEPFVESALAALRDGKDIAAEPLSDIEPRLLRALESLPESFEVLRSDARYFSGGRTSAAARARFLGHAERLLAEGEAGAALALNLASREHVETLNSSEPSCAVLFTGEASEDAYSDPVEQPPKKGRPGSPKGPPRAIVLTRGEQAEPGLSNRLGRLLLGALRTVRDWLLGRPASY